MKSWLRPCYKLKNIRIENSARISYPFVKLNHATTTIANYYPSVHYVFYLQLSTSGFAFMAFFHVGFVLQPELNCIAQRLHSHTQRSRLKYTWQ